MADVSFADNLYGSSPSLRVQGTGLVGFCRVGFWFYARHDMECKPGMWLVKLHGGSDMREFWPMVTEADAVVDDFGNLIPVGLQ